MKHNMCYGNPRPKLIFNHSSNHYRYKNHRQEVVDTSRVKIHTSHTKSTLYIQEAEVSDSGLYRCVSTGRGSHNDLVSECSLYVFGKMNKIFYFC